MPTRVNRLKRWFVIGATTVLCAGGVLHAPQMISDALAAQAQLPKGSEKKSTNRPLFWAPPQIDVPVRSHDLPQMCLLPDVLTQAANAANKLYDNLQSFTAQEDVEYESQYHSGIVQDSRKGTFNYIVIFQQSPAGMSMQEDRQPTHGSHSFGDSTQDVGLPEMVLMFLPEIQNEYEMSCEASVEWNGQRANVVHFVSRKDKTSRTLSFRSKAGKVYPARIKGRAWISADSGEVLHFEAGLMGEMPQVTVHEWYIAIDYAPVQFQSQNVRMSLPQSVDAYCDFGDHRTISYHTFTNFLLFSVQTGQSIANPTNH